VLLALQTLKASDDPIANDVRHALLFRIRYVIVHPSFLRTYDDPILQLVWGRTSEELVRAARWVFVGYSLPPVDVHFRELLRDCLRVRAARGGDTDICLVGRASLDGLTKMAESYGAAFGDHVRVWNATANGFSDFPAAMDE
jgi:hypothetical protein